MVERVVSGLVIVTGLVAGAVGITAAAGRLRTAARAHRRIETLSEAMPEGWSSWFLGGFSAVTMGTHWVRALVILAGWTMAGLCLIGLGLRLIF